MKTLARKCTHFKVLEIFYLIQFPFNLEILNNFFLIRCCSFQLEFALCDLHLSSTWNEYLLPFADLHLAANPDMQPILYTRRQNRGTESHLFRQKGVSLACASCLSLVQLCSCSFSTRLGS